MMSLQSIHDPNRTMTMLNRIPLPEEIETTMTTTTTRMKKRTTNREQLLLLLLKKVIAAEPITTMRTMKMRRMTKMMTKRVRS
jgi:hypothetical protein